MVLAKDLIVGKSYIYIPLYGKSKNMGKLLKKGEYELVGTGTSSMQYKLPLTFEKEKIDVFWDDEFREVKTTSGGKRKTRRNRKSKKLRKSKSRKNRKKSNRRR
jgi:hypothetical protein